MSRSYKHNPFCGFTTARTEKPEKIQDHRKRRARVRSLLAQEKYELAEVDLPRAGWFAKDGKQRLDPNTDWKYLLK